MLDCHPHHDERRNPTVTATSSELVAQLQDAQRREWLEAQAADAARRAEYPDAQWDLPLDPPTDVYDLDPAGQQAFADSYRAENPLARADDVGAALLEARRGHALGRWRKEALDRAVRAPACACCGGDSRHQTAVIGSKRLAVCPRCQPSVSRAVAELVAREPVAGGRTRAEAAKQLVSATLEPRSAAV